MMEWHCAVCETFVEAGSLPAGWGIRRSPLPDGIPDVDETTIGGQPVCPACTTPTDLAFRAEVFEEVAAGQKLRVVNVHGGDELTSEFDFVCPFCGAQVHVARDAGGESALIHLMSPCPKFLDLDPTEYMRAVNRERAKGLPS